MTYFQKKFLMIYSVLHLFYKIAENFSNTMLVIINELTLYVHQENKNILLSDEKTLQNYFNDISHAADLKDVFDHADVERWPGLLKLIKDKEQRWF